MQTGGLRRRTRRNPKGFDGRIMKTKDILALPVHELIDPEGCHLYLWTTNNFLPDALEVVKAWGFEYVTLITWMKDRQGLGQYYRGLTEHCIFARTKKRLPYKMLDGKRQQGVTGFQEAKSAHSRKPETMRRMIERVSYAPRIELFAREKHRGGRPAGPTRRVQTEGLCRRTRGRPSGGHGRTMTGTFGATK